MSNGTGIFSIPAVNVITAVGCTWCLAGVGEDCAPRDLAAGRAHAQRWRDYWNATHDRRDRVEVYPAPWLASA